MNEGKNSTSGKYYQFHNHIKKRNADAAKTLLKRLKTAADAGNCQVCMWILSRRFPEDFGRRVYRKTDVVSESKNVIVDIAINDVDGIRKQILAKFERIGEGNEFSII